MFKKQELTWRTRHTELKMIGMKDCKACKTYNSVINQLSIDISNSEQQSIEPLITDI